MNPVRIALLCGALALAGAADAQTAMRVRGTITSFDGNVLALKSREGQDLKLQLVENATVAVAKPVKFEEFKPGDYVGAAAVKRPDGTLVALEVHFLPPTVPPGHIPWDLQPGSTMTNANVEASSRSSTRTASRRSRCPRASRSHARSRAAARTSSSASTCSSPPRPFRTVR